MDLSKVYNKLPDSIKFNNKIYNLSLKFSEKLRNTSKSKNRELKSQYELLNILFTQCNLEMKGESRNLQLLYLELLRFLHNVCEKHAINLVF